MINIYAANFTDENGVFQDSWTLIQTVPAQNADEIYLQDPKVTVRSDTAETMTFTVNARTKYFNAFKQMKSYIRVDYDGTTIFYGRVLTMDTGYYGNRKIQCEGPIAFLNDTYYEGKEESKRNKISIEEYLDNLLSNHNSSVQDNYKKIRLGEVPGNYSEDISGAQKISASDRKFGESSWMTTKSALENLKSHYGGFFRTRYTNGKLYLDWMKHYSNRQVIDQTVAIGRNVIDLNYITEVNNIFTAIIPFGKSGSNKNITIKGYRTDIHSGNYLTVSDITQLYTDEQLNSGYHRAEDYHNAVENYGLIFKTVEFQDATNQSKLLNEAAKWIKENYYGGIDSFTVSAVDLHLIGENVASIAVGDRVRVQYIDSEQESKVLTCTSIDFDIYNPEKNQYTFGIPSSSLNKNFSVSSKKSAGTKSPAATTYQYPEEKERSQQEVWLEAVLSWFRMHLVWYKSNNNVEGGPNSTRMMNYFLRPSPDLDDNGNAKQVLWAPRYQVINKKISWVREVPSGHPVGTFVTYKADELTVSLIQRLKLIEYVLEEYNLDLRTNTSGVVSVDMPSIITTEDGTTEILNLLGDGEDSPLIQKILEFSKDGNIMNLFSLGGDGVEETLAAWVDELGNFHYYLKNDDGTIKTDDQGNPIEVNINSINDQVVTINGNLTDAELLLAEHGRTITKIDSDVTIIGGDLTQAQLDIAANGQSITALNSDVTSIGAGLSNLTVTTDNIIANVAKKNRIFPQMNDPSGVSANLPMINGDIWVKTSNTRTWSELSQLSWAEVGEKQWKEFSGCLMYVWKNGAWQQIYDETAVVDTYTRVEQDDEHWKVLAHQVDILGEQYDSNLNVTAQKISTEVTQTKAGLQSSIEQTAQEIKTSVSASKSELYSTIIQTATNVFSGVYDKVGQTFSTIEQTANMIRTKVVDENIGGYSTIVQTATMIYTKVVNENIGSYSTILQTATMIYTKVVDENIGSYSTIEQTASQLSLKVGKGEIASSINLNSQGVKIQASKIDLDGYVSVTNLGTAIASIANLNVQKITSERGGIDVSSVSTRTYVQGGITCYVPHAVTSLQIAGPTNNVYTLQYKWFSHSDWRDAGNFSRAITSWDLASSDGTMTVKAKPQDQTLPIPFTISGPIDISSNGNKTYSIWYQDGGNLRHVNGADLSVTVGVYTNSITVTRTIAGKSRSGVVTYSGILYYKDAENDTYERASSESGYWYFSSNKNLGSGSHTLHY